MEGAVRGKIEWCNYGLDPHRVRELEQDLDL